MKGKQKRLKALKKKRKDNRQYSLSKKLDYRINQKQARVSKGDKGYGCSNKAFQLIREKYPDLLTKQGGGKGVLWGQDRK